MSAFVKTLIPLNEGSQPTVDIVQTLNNISTVATIDSTKIMIRCAVILGKELTRAMMTSDPNDKLIILEKALTDARALRSAASSIPDDNIADYAWAAMTCWWKAMIKYGLGTVQNDEGTSATTRNSTLGKFDLLIKFLKREIAKTKLEIAKSKTNQTSTQ